MFEKMFGAIFALIILPVIIIAVSIILYYLTGKREKEKKIG